MKRLTSLLFALLILAAPHAALTQDTPPQDTSATQETFAPLISENCVLFIHADFRQVEIDPIKTALSQLGEHLLQQLGFDEPSFKGTARELTVELDKADALVRPVFDTVTKELGIREIALICDANIVTNKAPFFLAVSWKNKTDNDLARLHHMLDIVGETFSQNFVLPQDLLFTAGDFLIMPLGGINSEIESVVKNTLAQEKPSQSPIFEALKDEALKKSGQSGIRAVFALHESLRSQLKSLGNLPDIPEQIKNVIVYAIQKVRWAGTSVSFSELIGGAADLYGISLPESVIGSVQTDDGKHRPLLTVKTMKPSDATILRNMLEKLIDYGITAGQAGFAMQMQEKGVRIPPLAFQFTKGILRVLLPDAEGDTLIFRAKGHTSPSTVAAVGGIGIAMALPAVQAAREAARRMQCSNKLQNLGLALHTFASINNNKFPALYTVDEDGKPLHSWRVLILPQIEEQTLYSRIRLDEPWDSEYNRQFHDQIPAIFQCPASLHADSPDQACSYSAIVGGAWLPAEKAGQNTGLDMERIHQERGLSRTVAILETPELFCWMDPTADVRLDELSIGSYHANGFNACFFDAVTKFLAYDIDYSLFHALCSLDEEIPEGSEW